MKRWIDRASHLFAQALEHPWSRRVTAHALAGGKLARETLLPDDVPEAGDPALAFLNPKPLIIQGRTIVLGFVIVFMGWAALVPLSSALVAPGMIVVESHRKSVQHLEGGIVRAILVSDGRKVSAGQVLVQLDDTQAQAELKLIQGEVDALGALEARLLAERDGRTDVAFAADLVARKNEDTKVSEAILGESSAFNVRRESLQKQIDILTQRNNENARIIAGLRSQQQAVATQISLIARETESVDELFKKGLSTLPRLLALQRQAADLSGQQGQITQKIAQVQLDTGTNAMQIAALKNQRLSDVMKDLRDAQTRRFDLLERLHAARGVLARTTLKAPVSGTVVGLAVHTKGAVVRPGDTLMEIVPQKDALEVEARVRPEDASDVYPGMPARVMLSAYKQRRLPMIDGTVQTVSADRLTDVKTGQAYFNVEVTVDRSALKDYPDVRIIPGEPVEVSLDTGKRTMLSYLTQPIGDVFRRGMRER